MRIVRVSLVACLCAACFQACRSDDPQSEEPRPDLAVSADLQAAPADAQNPPVLEPPVACGSTLPGPPLKPDVAEAQPGYADELARLDPSQLADPLDYGGEGKLTITLINYMLGRSQGTGISHKEALQQGGLGRAVLFAAAKGTAGRIDFTFLRRGLHYFYPCSRPVPADLAELRRRYGDYKTWPQQAIACARPKNGPRRLYENTAAGVYIAETIVADAVRETEVLFTSLRTDGQLDFASYTDAGALSDRSTFATGGGGMNTLAAPYTCITCHVDTTLWSITRRTPTGTGAGCR